MLLTRTPLYSPDCSGFLVRLACVKRAASVDSEPGSNSRLIFGFVVDNPFQGHPGPSAYLLKISDDLLLTSLPTRLSMIYASKQSIPFEEGSPNTGLESRFEACCPISGFHQRRNPRYQKIWDLLRTSDEHDQESCEDAFYFVFACCSNLVCPTSQIYHASYGFDKLIPCLFVVFVVKRALFNPFLDPKIFKTKELKIIEKNFQATSG